MKKGGIKEVHTHEREEAKVIDVFEKREEEKRKGKGGSDSRQKSEREKNLVSVSLH